MPHRIFVVEDDARLSGLLVQRLREAGFVADCAADGLSAWMTIRRAPPDLVLVDIELPELDGLQLCKRLKNVPETAAIGVIIASARGDVVDRILGLELGADDYIVKPFEPREVIARVQQRHAPPAAGDRAATPHRTAGDRSRSPHHRSNRGPVLRAGYADITTRPQLTFSVLETTVCAYGALCWK